MHSLPLFIRLHNRPVILLGHGDGADAKRRILERAGATIIDEQGDATFAIVAIEEEGEARAATARLKSRGILVNAVDRPQLCDFTLPAIIDRNPVIIAIGTGGASAGLAKALRQRLEAMLPATLGHVATTLKSLRASLRMRWPDARDRRQVIDSAFTAGGPLDPFSPLEPDSVERWLDNTGAAEAALHKLIITSDNPDDLTLKQARLLGQADTIYHRRDIALAILTRARADAVRIACEAMPAMPPAGITLYLEHS
ncbi:MAG: NAD(P)-dependent oxidoreductase [Sphingomonadaceae bacterium]